jgi:aminomethyltransferase
MRLTPFYMSHINLKAEMITAGGGYQLPMRYQDSIVEYNAVRKAVGLNELSHMGEVDLKGKEAFCLVQELIVNDLGRISDNQLIYTTLCNENGRIIDDVTVYRFSEKHFRIITNAAPHLNVLSWIEAHIKGRDIYLTDISSGVALATLQGPKSRGFLQTLTQIDLNKLPFFNFAQGQIAGIPTLISRSGYTGELGYELYVDAESAVELWNVIMDKGSSYGLLPYGLAALQMLRIEKKYLLYGPDINTGTNPIEAGLGWTVRFKKGDFVGREALLKIKKEGPTRMLVGFEIEGNMVMAKDNLIYRQEEKIGSVTSANHSPFLNRSIGLGYVKSECALQGTELEIEKDGKRFRAKVVPTPFYDPQNKRIQI